MSEMNAAIPYSPDFASAFPGDPNGKITALYERLSRYDRLRGESGSITHQKSLLSDFASEHGLSFPRHFTDDGFSGTSIDRPGFSALLRAAAADRVSTIVVKDMSRLGRDYLAVGYLVEQLRQNKIRLISLGDNIDTFRDEDDFLPIRNIMNEWYVKNTSHKIHTTLNAKGRSGARLMTSCFYGYTKDPNDKDKWIIEPEAADVVRRIFRMSIEGMRPADIAKTLKFEKIELPGAHTAYHSSDNKDSRYTDPGRNCNWTANTVLRILNRLEYTGCTVNFKTSKHYKDKKSHRLSKEQQMIFPDTQEAIIDLATFKKAHACLEEQRRNRKKNTEAYRSVVSDQSNSGISKSHPLISYLRCADCGSKMYFRPRKPIEGKYPNACFECAAYKKHPVKTYCNSSHHVKVSAVEEALRTELLRLKNIVLTRGISALRKKPASPKEMQQITFRVEKLKADLTKYYEDYVLGRITKEQYESLSASCEEEQKALQRKAEDYVLPAENNGINEERFEDFLLRFDTNTEIDYAALSDYLDHIDVFEREKKHAQNCHQEIRIVMKAF